MTLIDLRASALNVTGYPGNAHTITLAWPAGTLAGTTWAATVGGEPVDSVTIDGDDLVVALTIPETVGGYELLLIQTDVDAVKAAGRVRSTETPTTDTDSTNLTVTLSTAEGSVTVVGTGPAGAGGGVTDGDKGDVVVSGGVWSLEDGVVTPAKLSFDPATQAEIDGEATTRANADTAFDGRLDTVEATLPTKADLVAGVVPTAQMPAITIMERVPVADEAARLALTNPGDVQVGDVAVQADTGTTWLLVAVDPSLAGSWKAIDQSDAVSSVNGQTGTVVLGKADVGLGNVDNTADTAKPISTATQTALDAKAPVASPNLTGTPTAPTAAAGTNTTQIATTAHVKTAVDNATSSVVPASLFDANTILKADTDDTPVALPVPASRLVGRKATGGIAAVSPAEVAALFGTPDGTKFLADDGTLKTPAGGSTAAPGVKVVRRTALTVPNATATGVPFDFSTWEMWDTDGFHDPAVNPSRLTVPAGKAGRYACEATAVFAANATGRRVVRIQRNGNPVGRMDSAPIPAQIVTLSASVEVTLAVGDYIELGVYQDSGANLNLDSNSGLFDDTGTVIHAFLSMRKVD